MRWLLVLLVACAAEQHPAPPSAVLAQVEASVDLAGAPVGHTDKPTVLIWFASWCHYCHEELAILEQLQQTYHFRLLGLNYKGHEEYAGRGSPAALTAFLAAHAPWLRVVPADDALFAAFSRPPKIPMLFFFDAHGTYIAALPNSSRARLEHLLNRM